METDRIEADRIEADRTAPGGTGTGGTAPGPVAALTVSEAAERVGLSAHTLRWYERIGLLDPVRRDTGGRRRYSERDVERLRFLTKLRATGMPIADMLRYVELVQHGTHTGPARLVLLTEHRDRVLDQIAALQRDLAVIEYKIDMYRDAERGTRPA